MNMHAPSVSQLAQELVDKTKQMKELSAEIDLLKLEIYDNAIGGITCDGGRIFFVDDGSVMRFQKSVLAQQLCSRFGLDKEEAGKFIDDCKVEQERVAYITVLLD